MTERSYMRTRARVGSRLRWAVVDFAAQEITALRPARRRAMKEELLAFIGPPMFARGESVELPSDEELEAAHARVREIIRSLVTSGRAVIARGIVEVGRDAQSAWTTVNHPDDDIATDAAVALGRLLARNGHRVKECPAPRTVGKADPVRCRRWFLGRPNQRCCSEACANRKSTREARVGRALERYRGATIEVQSHELYSHDDPPRMLGRWQPAALISDDAVSTYLDGKPLSYSSKTRADEEARRLAYRLVDSRLLATPRPAGAVVPGRRKAGRRRRHQ